LCIDNVHLAPETLAWDNALCERLRAALPEVRLLHWNGQKPLWMA
jgi:hypothetical protein